MSRSTTPTMRCGLNAVLAARQAGRLEPASPPRSAGFLRSACPTAMKAFPLREPTYSTSAPTNDRLYWVCKAARCIAFQPSSPPSDIGRSSKNNIALDGLADLVEARAFGPGQWGLGHGDYPPSQELYGRDGTRSDRWLQRPSRRSDSLELKVADLVKIDVQGMARLVLSSASEPPSPLKPPLRIEINRSQSTACQTLLESTG